MAIGCSELVAEAFSTSNTTSYSLGAVTPSTNSTLVVLAFASGTVASAPTMSGGGLTWKLITRQVYNSTSTLYAFYANVGDTASSTTITFNCSQDAATGCALIAFQFTGTDLLTPNPIRQFKTRATTAANPAVTFAANMDTNNGYCAGFGVPRNPPTSTAPGSWTEVADGGYSTPTSGATGAYRAGGETGATVTFTSASAAYGMVAVEVYASGAGPAPGANFGTSLQLPAQMFDSSFSAIGY